MITLAVGAVLAYVLWRIGDELRRRRHEAIVQELLATFAPAVAAVRRDPQQLLAWYPLARMSRRLFPDAFKRLDEAAGAAFPFTADAVQVAHAQCTAEWLAWERTHDAEYSVKIAQIQDEIERMPAPASPLLRTRLAAAEQQKLGEYQRRYEQYIKTAKALAALNDTEQKLRPND